MHTWGQYYWLEDLLPSCADSLKIDQQLECSLASSHLSVQSSLVVVLAVVGFSSWSQTTLSPFKVEAPRFLIVIGHRDISFACPGT